MKYLTTRLKNPMFSEYGRMLDGAKGTLVCCEEPHWFLVDGILERLCIFVTTSGTSVFIGTSPSATLRYP